MFLSLRERIDLTRGQPMGRMSRLLQYAGVFVLNAAFFGLLFLGVAVLE